MKCIECYKEFKEISVEHHWCSFKCKEKFYNTYYAGTFMAKKLELEYAQLRITSIEKYQKWKKDNPLKGIRDYLLSLGKFKDVPIKEEEK